MESETKDYGPSSVGAAPDFPVEAQFCVSVMDDHASGFGYPRGTALHCAFPDVIGPAIVKANNKKVVVWSPRQGSGGLGEILIGRLKDTNEGGEWVCEGSDGREFKGRPIGVVLYSYRRE